MVINTNLSALNASRNLAGSTSLLERSLARLSSGKKIIQPQDDAAGLAMSARLDARLTRIDANRANLGNTVSFLQTADGYLGKVQGALERMSELATLATDPTKTSSDRSNYNLEYQSLANFIASEVNAKTFNGVTLFSASGMTNITIYTDEDASVPFTIALADVSGLAASLATGGNSVITTAALGASAVTSIKAALDSLTTARARLGADMSRVLSASDSLAILKENVAAASSRIKDVNVADESALFARYSILVQSGTAMLAQANVLPQTALRLLS